MKYAIPEEILGEPLLKLDGEEKQNYLLDCPPVTDESLKLKIDTVDNQCNPEKIEP